VQPGYVVARLAIMYSAKAPSSRFTCISAAGLTATGFAHWIAPVSEHGGQGPCSSPRTPTQGCPEDCCSPAWPWEGLGAFLDGNVLHQIPQSHHMLTAHGHPANNVRDLEINTLWVRLFHSSACSATALGVLFLWRAMPVARPGWRWRLVGLAAVG
jgi:hypothetical protein